MCNCFLPIRCPLPRQRGAVLGGGYLFHAQKDPSEGCGGGIEFYSSLLACDLNAVKNLCGGSYDEQLWISPK